MDSILDEYLNETALTQEEREESNKLVKQYHGLDMDLFVRRIGGHGVIDEMRRINEAADRLRSVNGTIYKDRSADKRKDASLDEWKKGFMEGFEEAYKRLHG